VTGPFQTALKFDEIAIEALVPAPVGTRAGGYLKLERRVGDFATVGVAVSVEFSGNQVARAGIGLTGVGASTICAEEAAGVLVGEALTADSIDRAAALAAEISNPRSDHRGSEAYKRHIVATFVMRILSNLQRTTQEVT
jgi:carbon-monoxide dehydrogenase medium subunit